MDKLAGFTIFREWRTSWERQFAGRYRIIGNV